MTEAWLRQADSARPDSSPGTGAMAKIESVDAKQPFSVLEEFKRWREDPELAMAVAAIKALTAVIKQSDATTMMGLEKELKEASDALKERHRTALSLSAGCDLFLRYVTRTSALEYESFSAGKSRLIERGERFSDISLKARETIAMLGQDFIRDGSRILVHGFSRVVLALCRQAAVCGKHFSVVCTEGRADNAGLKMASELAIAEIPVTLVLDAGVAYIMERVDMVMVGADAVVESGGVMNALGTYQVALVARALNKPVYVAAESYKFARMYPLDQRDVEPAPAIVRFEVPLPEYVEVENSARDYTPPDCLTLLFTDLGVLTPSAVSDELIQLYL